MADERAVAPNWQENIYFSTERAMRIRSAAKKVESISDRVAYLILILILGVCILLCV
jgi:hypothetical protein